LRVLWIVNTVMPQLAAFLDVPGSASGSWLVDIAERLVHDAGIDLAVACVHGAEFRRVDTGGVTYYLLPGTGKNMMFYTRRFERLWPRILEDFKPDLVHLHGTEYSHGLTYLRGEHALPTVVSVQGLLARIKDVDLEGLSAWDVLRFRTAGENLHLNGMFELHMLHERNALMESEILRRVKFVSCVNTWDESIALSINPRLESFRVEYNLRDEFYSAPNWSLNQVQRGSLFTNPGGVPLKGLHMLLRALSIVKAKYPEVSLVVPGMGDGSGQLLVNSGYAKYISALLDSLDLERSVEFLERQTPDEIMNRMRSAHAVVIPSAIEGTSLMLREAMFLGVPCVAAFRGGMADFIDDRCDGFLYDFPEYPYLAHRILQLFESDELCRRFSQRASEKAHRAHDREANLRANLSMYERILHMSGSPHVLDSCMKAGDSES